MNSKPHTTPRFAVDRAAFLAHLPGVRLAAAAKRFVRGEPKLEVSRSFPPAQSGAVPIRDRSVGRGG